VSTPLTGDASTFGQDIRDAVIYANEKLAGGRYKLDVQDDKCNPKEAVTITNLFVRVNRYRFVTGLACSGPTKSAAPILNKEKTLSMILGASDAGLRNAGEYIFRSTPSDEHSGKLLAGHVAQSGIRHLGILSSLAEFTQGMKVSFESALPEPLTMQITSEDYLPEMTDFRPSLLKLKSKGVDGIFLNAQVEASMIQMLRDLDTLQWRPKLYGAYYPSSPIVLKESPDNVIGVEFVDLPTAADALNVDGQKTYDEYKARFGVPRSYDAIFLTSFEGFRALHQAISSGEEPVQYLLKTTFNGIFGPFAFDKDGEITGLNFVMKRIEAGRKVVTIK